MFEWFKVTMIKNTTLKDIPVLSDHTDLVLSQQPLDRAPTLTI